MDPTEYYTGVSIVSAPSVSVTTARPVTAGVLTTIKTPVVPATTTPQRTPVSSARQGLVLPGSWVQWGAALLVLVVAAGLFLRYRRKKETGSVPSAGSAVLPAPAGPGSNRLMERFLFIR